MLRNYWLFAALALILSSHAYSASFTVSNLNDSGAGSLRQALLNANASAATTNIITFNSSLAGILTLASALPLLNSMESATPGSRSTSIVGSGSSNLIISGNNSYRIFFANAGNVNISGMTLKEGKAIGGQGGDGGYAAGGNGAGGGGGGLNGSGGTGAWGGGGGGGLYGSGGTSVFGDRSGAGGGGVFGSGGNSNSGASGGGGGGGLYQVGGVGGLDSGTDAGGGGGGGGGFNQAGGAGGNAAASTGGDGGSGSDLGGIGGGGMSSVTSGSPAGAAAGGLAGGGGGGGGGTLTINAGDGAVGGLGGGGGGGGAADTFSASDTASGGSGGNGGLGGGGGGAGASSEIGAAANGGSGGDFGGGGGGSNNVPGKANGGNGGSGGFGAGGGGAAWGCGACVPSGAPGTGGAGGFGAGGGGGNSAGTGGFGAGAGGSGGNTTNSPGNGGGGGLGAGGALFVNGSTIVTLSDVSFVGNSAQGGTGGIGYDPQGTSGGGGAGFGGAVFLRQTGQLILGSGTISGGSVLAGSGGSGPGIAGFNGTAAGSGIYLNGQQLNAAPAAGSTLAISDDIMDDTGNGLNKGSLVMNGLGTLVLGGTNTFTGSTQGNAGTLVNNGSLTGGVNIASGATYSGSGASGALTISAGAVHIPTADTASQNVSGIYLLNGELRIITNELGPTAQVSASAGVTLGASSVLNVVESNGVYIDPVTSTIVDNRSATDNAIVGTFGSLAHALAFIDLSVIYNGGDGNDIEMTLRRNSTSFASVAQSNNQKGSAAALDAVFASSAMGMRQTVVSLLNMNAADAREAFEQIAGEIYPAATDQLLTVGVNLSNRLSERRFRSEPLTAAIPEEENIQPSRQFVVWGLVLGDRGELAKTPQTAQTDFSSTGALAGVDGETLDGTWYTLATGYQQGQVKLQSQKASMDISSVSFSGLAGRRFERIQTSAGITWTRHALSSKRALSFGSLNRNAQAEANTNQLSLFADADYNFKVFGFQIQPGAGFRFESLTLPAMQETGAQNLNIKIASSKVSAAFARVGVQAGRWYGRWFPQVRVGWQKNLSRSQAQTLHRLAGGGPAFKVEGASDTASPFELAAALYGSLAKDLFVRVDAESRIASGRSEIRYGAGLGWGF